MILEYLARFLLGGLFVSLFAVISQACEPRQFSGLFSAAPSVLLASLALTLLIKGADSAEQVAWGAVAGSTGMIAYCLVDTHLSRRFSVLIGSLISLLAWVVISFAMFEVIQLIFALVDE